MCIKELDSALLRSVYPLISGSSGTVARYLSRLRLKVSTEHPDIFLIFIGSVLNSLGPLIPKLLYLTVWKCLDPLVLTDGTMQLRPLRGFQTYLMPS